MAILIFVIMWSMIGTLHSIWALAFLAFGASLVTSGISWLLGKWAERLAVK
jgi:membrane protein YqaA with SNARE-associated domain